ncbi:EKC/KEOPS complex subunit Tprkb [Dendroctonus ponderosae]|uniref:EKC/KEOPS complex subunit Tprkb n=1 Tax=Dendroctonus ponderosae TaxID=77166 RepID=UPI0020358D59|nr:EKC/KEOPS complex subunit Tprkb [Dendroctonus ponderosae]
MKKRQPTSTTTTTLFGNQWNDHKSRPPSAFQMLNQPQAMWFELGLDARPETSLKMQLYENVRNARELRALLMGGQLQCCLIKPQLIVAPLQVAVAANKALSSSRKRTTKGPFTEILFNLSPSTNISQSLVKFGIEDGSDSVLVAALRGPGFEDADEAFARVQGCAVHISQLAGLSDVAAIRKTYKIGDVEHQSVALLDSVVSRIASKE